MSALSGKVIMITGASSGIGEAIARRLAQAGATLVLTARRADRLEALARELDPSRERIMQIPADVTVAAEREALVAITVKRFGHIDALINNAGYGQRGPLELMPMEALRRNYEVNVFAVVALSQKVAPHMRAQGHGRIINIGSVAGRIARPLTAVYDSTKHALEAISDGLRGELAPFGVQVVVIRPGFIATEFVDAANTASAETMADYGPYAPYLDEFRGEHAKLRRWAAPPDDVARVVEKALLARRPSAHYATPLHAKFFLFARWLLPTWIFDRFVRLKAKQR
ncbi:MAG: SDR family NAD(P)-dependent oxidoreductase [Opitutaceae bacterium]|nr:SDR family NAD(P)-dependent oxidoreductase [Opitutaceae bacterium]